MSDIAAQFPWLEPLRLWVIAGSPVAVLAFTARRK